MGNFNMLPYEIMLDILSRLPAESVLESKCVSKSWRSLVQHPFFAGMHLNHLTDSGKVTYFFYCREQKDVNEFCYSEYDENCHEAPFNRITRINLNPPFEHYSLVGSCNGLVCFDAWQKQGNQSHLGPSYICNPITREYIMLPKPKGLYCGAGFGYILSTNEYKVVRMYELARRRDSFVGTVEVYTLGSGSGWRNLGTMDIDMDILRRCAGTFANGSIYWLDCSGTIILSFDLADEKFSQLPPPQPSFQIGVLGDYLSVTSNCRSTGMYDLWLLKKNKDNNDLSWSKDFSFNTNISGSFGYTESGRLLSLSFGGGKIYSYDPNASFAKVDVSFGKSVCQVIPHKNTFVSLKVLGEKDTKTMEASGERPSSSEKKIVAIQKKRKKNNSSEQKIKGIH